MTKAFKNPPQRSLLVPCRKQVPLRRAAPLTGEWVLLKHGTQAKRNNQGQGEMWHFFNREHTMEAKVLRYTRPGIPKSLGREEMGC